MGAAEGKEMLRTRRRRISRKATWRSRATWRRICSWKCSVQRIWRKEATTQMGVEGEERMGCRQIQNPISTLFIRVRNVIFVIQIVNVLFFPLFHSCGRAIFPGQCGTVGQGRIANETAIGSENREVHLSGPFIRVGVHCYRRCTEGINSLVGRLNNCIHHPYGHEPEHHYH